MNPLIDIQNVLTRGDQSLPRLEEAIKVYTLNGAYALNQDDITGSIQVGKFPDIIVLDKNISEVPTTEIDSARILWTLLEGQEMYHSDDWQTH